MKDFWKKNKLVIGLLIVGLLYRLMFVLKSNIPPVIFDATAYDELALSLLQTGRFEINQIPFAFYTPGYPFLVTAVYFLFGESNFMAVRLVQVVLSTLNMWLGYRIIQGWLGRKVAVIALALFAFYSPFVYANSLVLTEVWYTTWLLVWLSHLIYIFKEKSGGQSWWFNGMLLGAMLLIRPVIGLFVPGMIILRVLGRVVPGWIRANIPTLKQLTLMLVGAGIVLMPWIARNYHLFDKFIPFSAESGNVFLLGTYVGYKHEADYPNWPVGETAVETDSLKIRYGISRIKDNLLQDPAGYSWWYISKFKFFWFWPYSEGKILLPKYEVQQGIHKLLVWIAFGGMYLALKKRERVSSLMVILLGYLTAVHMAFMTLDRLAFPTMYLVLGFSAVALLEIWKYIEEPIKRVEWKKQLSPGGLLAVLGLLGLLFVFTDSRWYHFSLLQWFGPTEASVLVVVRKVMLGLVSLALGYSLVVKILKVKTWLLLLVVSGLIFVITSAVLIGAGDREEPFALNDSVNYSKLIDVPDRLRLEGETWELKVKLGRDFRGQKSKGKVLVLVDDVVVGEVGTNLDEKDWRHFSIGEINKEVIKVEIKTEGVKEEEKVFLWGLVGKNYGLSLLDGKFGALDSAGKINNGSYEIGLSRSGENLNQVPIWYGSGSYKERSKLLEILKSW